MLEAQLPYLEAVTKFGWTVWFGFWSGFALGFVRSWLRRNWV